MNIYEAAMKLELEGKAMYEEMLAQTSSPALQGVLKKLISMEENHYEVFEAMRDNKSSTSVDEVCVKTIIESLKEASKANEEVPESEKAIQVYENALALENSASGKYAELAASAKSEEEREAFKKIEAEEAKHQKIIKNIIEFIKDPEYYMASAEFNPDEF